MGSKILINATHREEVRVAIIENKKLMEYDHDRLDNVNKKGCIYKGIVSRIEPSLNAAFVNYGDGRHGFLPASEVTHLLYPKGLDRNQKHSIQHLLQKEQEILVQVEKEEQGNKGAALTTNISLAGCYIVLMPMTPGSGGISRQIEGEERDYLQRVLNQIDLPEEFSIIVRTASIGRSLEELLWDFNVLKSQWEAISQYAAEHDEPQILYKDGDLLSRVIRDYLKPSVEEILIDEPAVYQEVLKLVQHIRPDFLPLVKYYDATTGIPLFAHFQIEHEIESIFNPEVVLENGSTLVFDHREALTSIDINSARSTTSADITTTAFKTNLAAATEIARQIRLRNIGGQIVIDFIHMSSSDHARQSDQARQVETALKQGLSGDKARIQIGKISKLGLLEISRQRLKTALDKSQLMTCQNCHGRGTHRQPQSVALSILRLIEQEAIHYRHGVSTVHVHSDIAGFVFNTYRQALCDLEKRSNLTIQILTDSLKSAGDYEINFYSHGKDLRHPDRTIRNYVPAASAPVYIIDHNTDKKTASTPPYTAIHGSGHNPRQGSFFSKLWKFFFGPGRKISSGVTAIEASEEEHRPHSHGKPHSRNQESQSNRRRNDRHSDSRTERHGSGDRNDRHRSHERGERHDSQQQTNERSSRKHNSTKKSDRPQQTEKVEKVLTPEAQSGSIERAMPPKPERSEHPRSGKRPRHSQPSAQITISTVQEPLIGTITETSQAVSMDMPAAPVKKRPAKRPPSPLSEGSIQEKALNIDAPVAVEKAPIVEQNIPEPTTTALHVEPTARSADIVSNEPNTEGSAPAKKSSHRRRFHHKRGPRSAASSKTNPSTSDTGSSN